MSSRLDHRVYPGHTRFGPPPVVAFFLTPSPGWPDASNRDAFCRRLSQLGLSLTTEAGGERTPWAVQGFAGLARELLSRAGHESGAASVEASDVEGRFLVAMPCEDPSCAIEAGEMAARILDGIGNGADDAALRPEIDRFLESAGARMPDADARLIMRAARERGLPVMRLDQVPFEEPPADRPIRYDLFQVGYGRARRVFAGALPRGASPELLERVAARDSLVARLAGEGVPLPRQDLEFPNKNKPARAVHAAERLGYPVTVRPPVRPPFPHLRPATRSYGPLHDAGQVRAAFDAAAGPDRRVWVEAHPPGERYRFLVIGGRVRAVARRCPPAVTGDGESSVQALIEARAVSSVLPRDARAWAGLATGDADVNLRLELAGLARDSVPEAGRRVALRAEGTTYNGGACEDVTDSMAAAFGQLAERVARCCGLGELAGIDMAIADLQGAAGYPNCAVLDVLPDPDLLSHSDPAAGPARDAAGELVDCLFPPGRASRVPLVAVTGTNGKTTTSRMVSRILRERYGQVGLTTTEGAFVNDESILSGDVAGVPGAAMVLADDRVEAAVLETARGGVITLGMAYDQCDAAACLNVEADHLGKEGIHTLEQMAEVKSRVLRRARDTVVINADDPLCLGMLDDVEAPRCILVTRDPSSETVARHVEQGGDAVRLETREGRDWIVFASASERVPVVAVDDIPATMGGVLKNNVFNALFAAGLSRAIGMEADSVRSGLRGFANTPECNPGRYNFIEGYPFTVLMDFAQNPHGLTEVLDLVRNSRAPGKRRVVCQSIGPRHRAHIDEVAAPLAAHFEDFVLGCSAYAEDNPEYAGDNPRRSMLDYFESRLMAQNVPRSAIRSFEDQAEGIRAGLETAGPGDLLVVLSRPEIALPVLLGRTTEEQGTR